MTETLTYTILKTPTKAPIVIDCPACGSALHRVISKEQKKGRDQCPMCGCEFEWERQNNG